MNPESWDERYSADEYVYGKEPNEFFKHVIDQTHSGRLLIPGEGEGRNAVYAAQRGWNVDASDISKNAMNKALKLAREKDVQISFQVENFLFFQPKTDYYNLTALIFFHIPRQQRRILSVKLWDSLRPGGKLVMEVFSKEQLKYNSGGPQDANLLYSEQDILTDFPCFKPEYLETLERNIKEGIFHNGKASVVRFIGTK